MSGNSQEREMSMTHPKMAAKSRHYYHHQLEEGIGPIERARMTRKNRRVEGVM